MATYLATIKILYRKP